jgi:tRNA threonylcarbamoyladenosine biosynthesis protein TsaB
MQPLLLHIHTATEQAYVALSKGDTLLAERSNNDSKQHAAFLHVAIAEMMNAVSESLQVLDAISISNGPGSYTGLRVGLAAAKGLCFALQKPLIALNTLEVMAAAMQAYLHRQAIVMNNNCLLCPMIDARRTELFMAGYNGMLELLLEPSAIDMRENDKLEALLRKQNSIFAFGSGAQKFADSFSQFNINMIHNAPLVLAQVQLALNAYEKSLFADVAYSEPYYLKQVYISSRH